MRRRRGSRDAAEVDARERDHKTECSPESWGYTPDSNSSELRSE
ncbi:hypothetical protein [Microbispora catharanthi]|nr:hypothetical protein [Microbispora catharanthi]